jgi:alpha-maltose-1-phosphate synthase
LDPGFQIVLCAGAPDTPAIAAEMEAAVAEAKRGRDGIFWISEMLDKESKVEFYSHAALFVCPSIYEPFGIINLEAMACGRPVVASAVGGIPEVVEQGETGLLVPVEQMGVAPFEPVDAERFSRDLAVAINELMADPARRSSMGEAGMRRAAEVFSWSAIAKKTKALYEKLAG